VALVALVNLSLLAAEEASAQAPPATVSAQGGIEQNKAAVRDFQTRMDKGDIQAALLNFADEVENHGRRANKQILGLILQDIARTFPDTKSEIVDMIAEGDNVVMRTKVSGTHKGTGQLPVNGGLLVGVPPTGKHYEVQHIHWFKLRDGKIVAHWANRDDIGMMQQLGLLPTPKRPESLNPPAGK
jgi:steroid delta-isomerase-like uncharacterized protein